MRGILLSPVADQQLKAMPTAVRREILRIFYDLATTPAKHTDPLSRSFSLRDGILLAAGKSWYFEIEYRSDATGGRLIVASCPVKESSGPH